MRPPNNRPDRTGSTPAAQPARCPPCGISAAWSALGDADGLALVLGDPIGLEAEVAVARALHDGPCTRELDVDMAALQHADLVERIRRPLGHGALLMEACSGRRAPGRSRCSGNSRGQDATNAGLVEWHSVDVSSVDEERDTHRHGSEKDPASREGRRGADPPSRITGTCGGG